MRKDNGGPEAGRNFSFRLNKDLPHERRALQYLQKKLQGEEGGVRKVVVDALLLAADNDRQLDEIAEMQRRALTILERFESGSIVVRDNGVGIEQEQEEEGAALTEEFKAGLRKIARPVLKLDELSFEDE